MVLEGFLSAFLHINLFLTPKKEVLEGHLLYTSQEQLEPHIQKASTTDGDKSSVGVPTVDHSLQVDHEINLEGYGQHLSKNETEAWLMWLSRLVPACKPKGPQFNSQSGHMPGFQAGSPMGGTREVNTH